MEDTPGNDEVTLQRKFGNEQYVWILSQLCWRGLDFLTMQKKGSG
jgi:hypothetical protein